MRIYLVSFLFFTTFITNTSNAQSAGESNPDSAARFLIVVTTDGLRWQEVFGGADSVLLHDTAFTSDPAALAAKYWAPTQEARRARLLPFFWSVLAGQGQLYGNRNHGNLADVYNRQWFSYPGYNEIFTGHPDDSLFRSNAKFVNPQTNVLEFLHHQPGFAGRVAAFSTWDVFPYILAENRAGFPVYSGPENRPDTLPVKHPDRFTWQAARKYLTQQRPRVLYLAFDDTDELAHEGRYDQYLDAAHDVDAWLAEIWQWVQSDPEYRGRTALLISTDHGRGDRVKRQWRDHGIRIEGAGAIWIAALGPGIPALGEVRRSQQLWQQQLAQTMAGLLGFGFSASHPVAPRIESVFGKR